MARHADHHPRRSSSTESRSPRARTSYTARTSTSTTPRSIADPAAFDPGRWEPERAKSINRSSFLAFGDGRRKCIGEEFAWTELLIVLATVVQRWRLTLTSAPPRPQAIVTVKPDKLSMTPQPRVPTKAQEHEEQPAPS